MKHLIKSLLLIVPLLLFGGTLHAQNDKQRPSREQLAEAQAKHIAHELALEDEPGKRFIDTYCQFQREIWALGPRSRKSGRTMNDEDTEKALKKRFEHSQKILDIRKKYYAIYSEFLTQKQIQRVYELERQMMNRLATQGKRRSARNR